MLFFGNGAFKIMKQTKIESIIERTADLITGFIISVLLYKHVILTSEWLWNSPMLVTTLFTIVSFCRGYMWRRFFNANLHKVVHKFVSRYMR